MLTRVFIAGEDAAHVAFVAGFLSAYEYPAGRIASDLSGIPKDIGRFGDGKERMFADASEAAKVLWSRRNHESSLLVLLHDLGNEERVVLRRRILDRVAVESGVALGFLNGRTVVLLPEPETEGWVAAMQDAGYTASHIGRKLALKRQAFHYGREAGRTCRRGEQSNLPESIRAFCPEVQRYTTNLR